MSYVSFSNLRKESDENERECALQAHLEWEQYLAEKNLRYYRKSLFLRSGYTEEFCSDTMRAAVEQVLDRRYGEKIREWRMRELFATTELAKLAAKREAAKAMQMAQQVTTWAQANRSAQQEQLPFFEPGPPSGHVTSPSAAQTAAAQQETIWPRGFADPDSQDPQPELKNAVGGSSDQLWPAISNEEDDGQQDDGQQDDGQQGDGQQESEQADSDPDGDAIRAMLNNAPESLRLASKKLVEEVSAFLKANPVPAAIVDEATAIATANLPDDVPLSQWTAQLLWTQSGPVSLAPWCGVKQSSRLYSPLAAEPSAEIATEIDSAMGSEETNDPQTEPPDES